MCAGGGGGAKHGLVRCDRLSGLVPPVYENLELQAERVMYQLRTFATTPLQKYDQLAQLAATNVTLYYKVGKGLVWGWCGQRIN